MYFINPDLLSAGNLINISVLFIMIGLLVLDIELSKYIAIIVPVAIVILIVSRAVGVFTSTVITGKNIPGNYNLKEFL